MKTFKIYYIILVLMSGLFFACSEYEDEVTPSPTVSVSSPEVRFQASNVVKYELDPDVVKSISLKVIRSGKAAALKVPIKVLENSENAFSIPDSLYFPIGKDTVNLIVGINNSAPTGVKLNLSITFDEASINPYKNEYPAFYGAVTLVQWVKYAKGIYTDPWYLETSVEKDLEYSPTIKQYRMKGLFDDGADVFYFTWDKANKITIGGAVTTKATWLRMFQTGYFHAGYSSYIYAYFVNDQTLIKGGEQLRYDAATKKFYFPIYWGLSQTDGRGYGYFISTYEITQLY